MTQGDGKEHVPTFRKLREATGLSQGAVAAFVKVTQATVSGWESGRLAVPEDRRSALRQLLGCSQEQLDAALAHVGEEYGEGLDTRLGDHIAAMRAKHGFSREQVAQATDVTAAAVALWESGTNRPSIERLEAFADTFDTDVQALLAEAGWSDHERDAYLQRGQREDTAVAVLLREARVQAGLTQTQVAAAIGVAQNSVSAMETSHYLPNAETWAKLTSLLSLEPVEAAVAMFQSRQEVGTFPEVTLPWPLDPLVLPRSRWFRQLRAHMGRSRAELADLLAVPSGAIRDAEHPSSPLPAALRTSDTMKRLTVVGSTDELTLRQAWQPEDLAGIEHLVGLPVIEQVESAARFDELLRALVLRGVTQTAIAEAAGVSREAARQWVDGRSVPGTPKLPGLAAFVHVEVARLEALRDRTKHPPVDAHQTDANQPSDADRIFGEFPNTGGDSDG